MTEHCVWFSLGVIAAVAAFGIGEAIRCARNRAAHRKLIAEALGYSSHAEAERNLRNPVRPGTRGAMQDAVLHASKMIGDVVLSSDRYKIVAVVIARWWARPLLPFVRNHIRDRVFAALEPQKPAGCIVGVSVR